MGRIIKFTPQEIEVVRSLYPTHSSKELAKIMHRSPNGIKSVAKRLGIVRTKEATERLRQNRLDNLKTSRGGNWRERLSIIRKNIYKKEIRRAIMGQKRKTKLHILLIPHQVARRMHYLKYVYNYFADDYNNLIMYYDDQTTRAKNEEFFSKKYGIKFESAE